MNALARRLAALSLLALAASVALPSTALAHGKLRSSAPAVGARLTTVPRELRLTFTEAPELAFARLILLGPAGDTVALSPLALSDSARTTLVAGITGPLRPGSFTVAWSIAGADGHPVRGRFSFTVAADAEGFASADSSSPASAVAAAPAAPTTSTAPLATDTGSLGVASEEGVGLDAGAPLAIAMRWLLFTGLLIAIGAVTFKRFVLDEMRQPAGDHTLHDAAARDAATRATERAARIGAMAAWLIGVSALLRLYTQARALHGADAFTAARLGPMLTSTMWGWGWLLQLAGVLVATLGFSRARRGHGAGWTIASVGVMLLALTPALSGHAASVPRLGGAAILADTLHVIGASGWLGSLFFVAIVGLREAQRLPEPERHGFVAALVHAFSPVALICAAIVAATGVFTAWLHIGSFAALWSSAYGQMLLRKLVLLGVVGALGAYNWRFVRPRLGDLAGTGRLRRAARIELAVGALVVAVTAALVATPPPTDLISP